MRGGARWAGYVLSGALTLAACTKKQETIVETGGKRELSAADLDRDPLALLPAGAIGVFHLDAPKLLQSEFGQKLLVMAETRTPVPPSADFQPERDLDQAYVGSYSMQGADLAIVLTGRFHPEKIQSAADGTERTPLGVPIVKSSYAGRTLYTAQNMGFTVLTEHTVLAGDETGIRRALDRIHDARVKREIPEFMQKLVSTPNAAVAGAADFRTQPVAQALRRQFVFLDELTTVQFLGNFEAPGMNFAGTLSYSDEQAAARGADALGRLQQTLQSYGFLMTLLGISQPVEKLTAQARGKDAEFVLGLNGAAISRLLDKAQQFLGAPGEPVPATLHSGISG